MCVATDELSDWDRDGSGNVPLDETVSRVAPHALIGVSGQPGLFDERVIRAMAANVEHPIVLPLSNPTPRAEAAPADVLAWSNGKALVGTGSPFPPVELGTRRVEVSQVNNVHIFPGIGMGALVAGATSITDTMMTVAADTVSARSPAAAGGPDEPLLPPIAESRETSRAVAFAVAASAIDEGVARYGHDEIESRYETLAWEPGYRPLE